MSLYDLKVGDRVKVFDINGPRFGEPSGGWDGTVVRVGRKLITVQYRAWQKVFRLESGQVNDGYGHRWIRTVEQAAEESRYGELVSKMNSHGLQFRLGNRLPLAKLEAVVRALEESDD